MDVSDSNQAAKVEPAGGAAAPTNQTNQTNTSQPVFVFGCLALRAEQVEQSTLLSKLVGLADHQTDVVVDIGDWPSYVVDATRWLDMWFRTNSTKYVAQMHGLAALDELLAAANWLDMKLCVEQIVEASVEASKAVDCTAFVAQHVVEIYDQLARQSSQNNFAPVSLDWPNMDKLCWLCRAMPTILRRSLEKLWITKLIGVRKLWLTTDKYLTNNNNVGPGRCVQQVPADAIVGADWYGVATCTDGYRLIRSTAAHYQHDIELCASQSASDFGQHDECVVAWFRGQSVDMSVSPCRTFVLWRLKDQDQTCCNMIIRLATRMRVEMPGQAFTAVGMWWLGHDQLAYTPPGYDVLHIVHPDAMWKLVCAMNGTSAVQTPALTCATWTKSDSTILSVHARAANVGGSLEMKNRPAFDLVCADPRDSTGRTFLICTKTHNPQHKTLRIEVDKGSIDRPETYRTSFSEPIAPETVAMLRCQLVWQL